MLQPSTGQPEQQQTIRLIAEVLAAGLAFEAAWAVVQSLLPGMGVGRQAARAGLALAMSRPVSLARSSSMNAPVIALPGAPVGPAELAERAEGATWRAAYMLAASKRIDARISAGMSVQDAAAAETPFFNAHRAAQARRLESARAVDAAASLYSPDTALLGWNASLDTRTTPDCAWANGKNFYATRRPVFGWPGSVHPNCRCVAGPAYPGARLLYAAPARLLGSH